MSNNPFLRPKRSQFVKGILSGTDAAQAAAYGATALAGTVLGVEGLQDYGLEGYQRNIEQAGRNAGRVQRFEDIGGVGDAADYAAYGVGQLVPFLATSVASGGAGAAAGGLAARKGAEVAARKAVQSGASQLSAKALARQAVAKGAQRGATAGAALNSVGTEQGLIYGDIYEETGQKAPGTALAYGAAAGLLDLVPELAVINRLTGPARSGALRSIGRQVLTEGATEGGQTYLENRAVQSVDPTKDALDAEGISEILNAALIGGIGGGAVGGVTQGVGAALDAARNRQDATNQPNPTEGENAEPPPILRQPAEVIRPEGTEPPAAAAMNVPPGVDPETGEVIDQAAAPPVERPPTVADVNPQVIPAIAEQAAAPTGALGKTVVAGALDGAYDTPAAIEGELLPRGGDKLGRDRNGRTIDGQVARPVLEDMRAIVADALETYGGKLTPRQQAAIAKDNGVAVRDVIAIKRELLASLPPAAQPQQQRTAPQLPAPTPQQQVAPPQAQAAPAFDETPELLDTDITPPSGEPFSARGAADLAARRAGNGARVVELSGGGFVVRQPQSARVDAAAAEAATSPTNDLPEPTEAQKEAGNYKKGKLRINGLQISIENPAGTSRRPEWTPLANPYGYIKRTRGADGDQIDVFLGPAAEDRTAPVFVVNQIDPKTGKFDEHKAVLGASTREEAESIYRANYAPDWNGLGSMSQMSLREFKLWLARGERKAQAPFAQPPLTPNPTATAVDPSAVTGDANRVSTEAGAAQDSAPSNTGTGVDQLGGLAGVRPVVDGNSGAAGGRGPQPVSDSGATGPVRDGQPSDDNAVAPDLAQRPATAIERALAADAPDQTDLRKSPTGWKRVERGQDRITLVSSDGKVAVDFRNPNPRSGTEARRMYVKAGAFAIDNPYTSDLPAGELVSSPIFSGPGKPDADRRSGSGPISDREFEHAGLKIYPIKVRVGDSIEQRWGVQLPENKGTDKVLGDPLRASVEEAKETAEYEASRFAQQKEREAQAKEKDAQDAERKAENRRKTIAQRKADAVLDRVVSDNGRTMTRREWVRRKVEEGLDLKVTQEDRIKPMSRMQFHRATQQEQDAHERKIREGGKKDVYWIGGYQVTKTEYDYASGLQAVRQTGDSRPADRRADPETRSKIDAMPADERDAEIQRLREQNAQLQQALDKDSVTGVRSREAYRRDHPNAKGVAFIDLIAFKGYNTKFTETGGDKILSVFGQVMLEVAGGQAYRRGGDEFAILSDQSPEHARELAEKLQTEMAKVRIDLDDKDGVPHLVRGIPFRTGIGATDEQAVADSASRKQAGDREENPNVERLERTGPEEGAVQDQADRAAEREGDRVGFDIYKDGIAGREISWSEVPNGNEAFQYALGSVEEGRPEAIYRRHADERGTYGGWRWEAPAHKLQKADVAGATHQDPGEQQELATDGVVREAADTVRDSTISMAEARKRLLKLIDDAISTANTDPWPANAEAEGNRTERARISRVAGYVTLKVPGDGTFRVVHNRDRLKQFRKQVQSQFKAQPSWPRNQKDWKPTPSLAMTQERRAAVLAEAEDTSTQEARPDGAESAAPAELADDFDLRGYALFYVKDGQVVSSGSVPAKGEDHPTNLGKYQKQIADSYGADLYIVKGTVKRPQADEGGERILGLTWAQIQAMQSKQGRASAPEKPVELPADAVRVYSGKAPETPTISEGSRSQSKVTPQVASASQLASFIGIAADSVGSLRASDVERVIREAPAQFRLALAEHIKEKRKDLSAEVDEALSEQRSATPADPAPTTPVTETTEAKAADPGTLAGQDELLARADSGEVTLAELKAGFESLVQSRKAITEELSRFTIAQLKDRWRGFNRPENKKSDLVDQLYRQLLTAYNFTNGSIGIRLGGGVDYTTNYGNAVRAVLEKTTDADLQKHAESVAEARVKRAERAEAATKAIADPKTYEDYATYITAKRSEGMTFREARDTLTIDQRITLDRLMAERSRGKRREAKTERKTEVRAAGQLTTGEVIETKHTKHGHDLFVVQLAERVSREDYDTLNASAKRLGGSYSSFRGRGAVPGFQFRTREAAEAFQSLVAGDTTAAQEVSQARRNAFEDDRAQSAVERLREMADRLDDRADQSLAQDRKANTERRARFAASAEASARADKAMAETMRKIAAAIESGKAGMLDQVRTKSQLELLDSQLRRAKDKQLRAETKSYGDYEKRQDEPPNAETVEYAEWPAYTLFRSDWAQLGRQLMNTEGSKLLGKRILKLADDVTAAFVKFAKKPENSIRLTTFTTQDGKPPKFGTEAAAEASIQRSGYRGKAVPLKLGRGHYTVIMSPKEARERGLWDGDPDQRITVSDELGAEIVKKIGKANRRRSRMDQIAVPWALDAAHDRLGAFARMGIETPAEMRTALREFQALRQAPAQESRVAKLERAMVGRKNDGLDFFPTSRDVVDGMLAAAEMTGGMTVLEPSGGMGHIADAIRERHDIQPAVAELATDRRELLEAKGYTIVGTDFMDMVPGAPETPSVEDIEAARDIARGDARSAMDVAVRSAKEGDIDGVRAMIGRATRVTGYTDFLTAAYDLLRRMDGGRYDRILMNPPFSKRRDAEHVRHAYTLLKPGGRLVAIMGEGVFFGQDAKAKAFREWLESVDGTSETLPDGSFMDPSLPVNTGVRARLVVIDKPESETRFQRAPSTTRPLSATAIQRTVDRLRAAWANAPDIVVIESMAQAPESVRLEDARQRRGGASGDPAGFWFDGKVYVVASGQSSVRSVTRTVLHEVLGHAGLRGTFGRGLTPVLQRIIATRGAEVRAKARQYGLTGDEGMLIAAEEVLAEMAEADPSLGLVRRAMAVIRQFLRRIGLLSRNEISDAEIIREYLRPARRFIERGERVASRKADPAMKRGEADERDLVAIHNTSARKLKHAMRMGGFAVPSIAVLKKNQPFTGFGDITLIGDSQLVDPKRGAKAFGADVYSPRYPQVTLEFTKNMRERGNKMLQDGMDATGVEYIEWESISDSESLSQQAPFIWKFLRDNGIDPNIVTVQTPDIPQSLMQFVDSRMDMFELARDADFIEAVSKPLREEFGSDKQLMTSVVRDEARRIEDYRRAVMESGKPDRMATYNALKAQIRDAGLWEQLEQAASDFIVALGPNEKLFQGHTNAGYRKYIPHTLANVVKMLKKDMRGGENFNYGVGSLRAKFTPQFRSIEQMRKEKYRLVSSKDFERVKQEVSDELEAVASALAPHYVYDANRFGYLDQVTSAFSDAAAQGLPRALSEYGFKDVPDDVQRQAATFLNKLRNLPTEYFEVNQPRAVELMEFRAAVVPAETDAETMSILRRAGLEVTEYPRGNDAARHAAVQSAAEKEGVLFHRRESGDTIDVDGTPRPRTNSNGKPIAQTDEALRNFWRWFGDSKVVDGQGRPLVVYHGSPEADFDTFKEGGAFFTSSKGVAQEYTRQRGIWNSGYHGNVRAFYLKAESPLEIDALGKRHDNIPFPGRSWSPKAFGNLPKDAMSVGRAFEEAKKAGNDSLVVRDVVDTVSPDDKRKSTVYAVVSPAQIKSATGNQGTFDPENPDIRFQRREAPTSMREAVSEGQPLFRRTPAETLEALRGVAHEAPKGLLERLQGKLVDWGETMLGALTLQQLGEVSRRVLPQIIPYRRTVQAMATDRNVMQERSNAIAERWQKWASRNRSAAEELADMMHDTTIAGVDPSMEYAPLEFTATVKTPDGIGWTEEKQPVTPRNIQAQIKMLEARILRRRGLTNNELFEQIKSLRDMLKAERARKKAYPALVQRWAALPDEAKALYETVRNEYRDQSNALLDAIEARVKESDMSPDAKRQTLAALRLRFESQRLQGPYFPLARFGKYWIASTNAEGEREFRMVESSREQRKTLAELKAEGHTNIAHGVSLDQAKASDGVSAEFMGEVQELFRKTGMPDSIRDEVWQLYLRTMPDVSIRKQFIHRKKTAGYSQDALRAFASHSFHGAFQLARVRWGGQLERIREEARAHVSALSKDGDPDAVRAGQAFNELTRRHDWVSNPTDSAIVNKLSSLGFFWYLGLTPGAALVNLLQTPTVTLPVLGARFGTGKAARALTGAMRQSMRTYGHIQKALTGEDLQAFQIMEASGAIDKTQTHNLAGISEQDTSSYNPRWHKMMTGVAHFFHKAEVMNREATGIAAFRLARQSGMSFHQAVGYAQDVIWESHYDYSNANRARFMQSGAAKVLLQFRQYALNTTYFLLRNAFLSMKGVSPQERTEARRKLVGVMGMSAVFAGALGMPVAGIVLGVANAVQAAFGDDDEPWDAEAELRAFLVDHLGAFGAEAVLMGPTNALTGLDIASRTNMDLTQLWFRPAERELEGVAYAHYLMEQIAGPIGGIGINFLRGQQLFGEGHYMRGIEAMLPKFAKDAVRSIRYAKEGANNLRGDPLVEDIGVKDAVAQVLGLSPAALSWQYDLNRQRKNYEAHILKRRRRLMDAYAMASRLGDEDGRTEIRQRMIEFSSKYPELAITADSLRKSLQARMRYSDRAEGGVVIDRRIQQRIAGELPSG